jgi:sugar lactone lactonase YvrE
MAINALGHVYVADIVSTKIYKTEDNGLTWHALPGIPSTAMTGIISIAFDKEQRLWVCTDGDGHFRTVETTVGASQPALTDTPLDVYPNPAQGGFWVNWADQTKGAPVAISLIDLYGRIVSQQMVDTAPAYFNTPDQAAGLYLVELRQAGRRSLGKVFIK